MNIPLTLRLNSQSIIDNLAQESIDVYVFLQEEFENTEDIQSNYLFHFIFRSFYRLDNAGLSNEMKTEYFRLMQLLRKDKEFNVSLVCKRLYELQNLKGQNTLQYSFTTKMANMISSTYPIYDSEVASMFGFRAPYNYKTYEQRFNEYSKFYSEMSEQYSAFSQNENVLNVFDELAARRAKIPNLSAVKKIDFLMWSAGKLHAKKLLKTAA